MAVHTPLQPAGVALSQVNRAFITAFSMQDRSFLKELEYIYGKEDFTWFLGSMGKKTKVTNNEFYHWETRSRLHHSVQVASFTGFGSAGANGVVTITSGSHLNSGTQSPLRVGEVVENPRTGVFGKITAINKASANAHTATIEPSRSTDTFTMANNDHLVFRGRTDVGAGSNVGDSLTNPARKITNTITQIRDDFKIEDMAAAEQVEFEVDGKPSYSYKGIMETEKRFRNVEEWRLIFGVDVTNTAITANGTAGTLGLIPQIQSRGGSIQSSAGSFDMSRFQQLSREADFNGVGSEIQLLQDVYHFQEVQNNLFSKYDQGAILWGSVGGSAEVAAKYGFQSLQLEGRSVHFKKYLNFNVERTHGIVPNSAYFRYFSMVLPTGNVRDPKEGVSKPIIEICYQDVPGIGEYNIYDTGGLARNNKTPEQVLTVTMITHKGLRLRGANQCTLVGASI